MARIDPTGLSLKEPVVVCVNRVAKVVAGGKRFSFNALTVVGDGGGHVGVGVGKANDVQAAVAKGAAQARKNLMRVPLKDGTIPHEVTGCFGAGKVLMKPASPGTGVVASAAVRAVLEQAGVKDILTKSLGTSNPFNVVYAVMEGLRMLRTPQEMEKLRGPEPASSATAAAVSP